MLLVCQQLVAAIAATAPATSPRALAGSNAADLPSNLCCSLLACRLPARLAFCCSLPQQAELPAPARRCTPPTPTRSSATHQRQSGVRRQQGGDRHARSRGLSGQVLLLRAAHHDGAACGAGRRGGGRVRAGREAGGEVAGRRAISCVCATSGPPQTPCTAACADCCDWRALRGAAPSLTGVAAGLGLCRGSGGGRAAAPHPPDIPTGKHSGGRGLQARRQPAPPLTGGHRGAQGLAQGGLHGVLFGGLREQQSRADRRLCGPHQADLTPRRSGSPHHAQQPIQNAAGPDPLRTQKLFALNGAGCGHPPLAPPWPAARPPPCRSADASPFSCKSFHI